MKVYGSLDRAQLENKATDYATTIVGLFWWNTATLKFKVDDGTNIRAMLRNDGYCVVGNSGTASQNIRLHRGAAGVLQLVSGADTTAEGTLSTAINQLSSRLENYTTGARPAAGNAGRVIWDTDLSAKVTDSGSAWFVEATGATLVRYDAIVGSAAQVTAGSATHSTWASAIAAVSAGDTIYALEGTWTENVSVDKQLNIIGSGYGTNITGSLTFTSAADRSNFRNAQFSNSVTINSGANLIKVSEVWLASGKTFVDNGTGNLCEGFTE